MSRPSKPRAVADTPIQRVLGTVERLVRDIDALDLDVIDGEFYWRCCRADLMPLVEKVRAFGPPPCVEDLATLPGRIRHDEWVALLAEVERVIPRPVLEALAHGDAVGMRMPDVTWTEQAIPGGGTAQWATVLVSAATWTGDDVERHVRLANTWTHAPLPPGLGEGWTSVHLDLALIDDQARAATYWRAAALLRVPFVAVRVVAPLPPSGAIAREYDAIVRDLHGWHLHLPGAGSRQDKEVALRTWGVALLLGAGRRFGTAMRMVCEAGRLIEVSQTRFGVDRQRVLERVPEARPFLLQRRRAA